MLIKNLLDLAPRQTLMDSLLPCERDFVKKSGLTRGITVKLGDKELFGHPKIVPYPYD